MRDARGDRERRSREIRASAAQLVAHDAGALAPGRAARRDHRGAGPAGGRAHPGSRGDARAFKGYRGYPGASICPSVNDEVVHGIPGERTLKEGDIVGHRRGRRGGRVSTATRRARCRSARSSRRPSGCSRVTREAPARGHRAGRGRQPGGRHLARGPGARRDARVLGGAGAGRARHRPRDARGAAGAELRPAGARAAARWPGMVLAIEPMVNVGAVRGRDAGRTAGRW